MTDESSENEPSGGATPSSGEQASDGATPAPQPVEKAKVPIPTSKKKKKKGGVSSVPQDVLTRRKLVWASIFGSFGIWVLWILKFFFPRTLFEPNTKFKIGFADEYALGVDTKWQQAKRIWVVKDPSKLYVILARCTHLGCTPDWKEADSKFKCPCHGSGFTMEGVNFEGPAPRPLQRCLVGKNAQGEIIVDKAILFEAPQWGADDASIKT